MSGLVKFSNGTVNANSREIADKFGKGHRDVLRAIDFMDCSDVFRARNFALSYYTSTQNKKIKCYEVTRDGFSFLGMGFTGGKAAHWKEAYINAFNSLERHIYKSDSMMGQINQAVRIMEEDKSSASLCGKGLSKWKVLKKNHEKEVSRLVAQSQMVLNIT